MKKALDVLPMNLGMFALLLFFVLVVVYIAQDAHRSVHAQQPQTQIYTPELPSVYDCNSANWSSEICRAYDPATKKHFIVVLGQEGAASIAPDEY